jgi:hypothetical protein
METLPEIEIGVMRNVVGWSFSVLASLMIAIGGFGLIFGVEWMQRNLQKIPNIGEHTFPIGVLHLLCVVLYWIPSTTGLGFILLCSLTGGMIVSEVVIGQVPIPGLIVTLLLYSGTMARKPFLLALNF